MTSPKCLSTHLRAIISPDPASLPGGASEGHEPLRELAGLLYGALGGTLQGLQLELFLGNRHFGEEYAGARGLPGHVDGSRLKARLPQDQ